jgi:hypothetical protein
MKSMYPFFLLSLVTIHTHAQVGIGTVSPNSMLDTRGSFSAISRTFSGATSLTSNDFTSIFTASTASAASNVRLPDAIQIHKEENVLGD